MENLFKKINHKINSLIWSLFSSGILLLLMAILIVWTDFLLRIICSLITLIVAYIFLVSAYKLWHLKNDITNHFRF
jgi:hypothetical protein